MKKLLMFSMAIVMALSACVQNNKKQLPEVGDKKYYEVTNITPDTSMTVFLVSEVTDVNDSIATIAHNYTFYDGEIITDTVRSEINGVDSQVSLKALFAKDLMMFNRDSLEFVEGTEKVIYKSHMEENTVMEPVRLVLRTVENGAEVMIELSVEERKVYAKEDVTTPAGTFSCIKFSENQVAKIGDEVSFSNVVYWFNIKNDVLVKQAISNKAGEPYLVMVLTKEE